MGFNGFKIVLISDGGLVGTYHRTYLGLVAGPPSDQTSIGWASIYCLNDRAGEAAVGDKNLSN